MPPQTRCIYEIEKLRPTQPEVGQYQIDEKVRQYKKLSKKELQAVIERKPVPVIVGPDGNLYLIDHHHTSLALLEAGEKQVHIDIKENWSSLDDGLPMNQRMESFWKKMDSKEYCFLKKADGAWIQPLSEFFPKTLKQCGDNPYRALVWILSENGYLKTGEVPYYEFYISELLKKRGLQIPPGPLTKKAIKKYVEQARKILDNSDVKKFINTVVAAGQTCDVHALLRKFK